MAGNQFDVVERQDNLLSRIDQAWFKVESVFNFLAAMVIMGLMFLAVVQVVGRKAFDQPIFGYVDIVEFFMALFAFLGIAYVQRVGAHVRMEIIIKRFKGRALWLIETFGTLVAMAVVICLIWASYQHFNRAFEFGDSSMNLELPTWPAKLMVPFAFTMLLIRLFLQLIGFLRLVIWPNLTPLAVPLMEDVEELAQAEIQHSMGHSNLDDDESGTSTGKPGA